MLKLNNITLISVDCVNPLLAYKALKYSSREIEFADTILFSSANLPICDVTVCRIEPISDLAGYSYFITRQLLKYVKTDFIITVQADGFITNPCLWRDKFLDYDYIGAPWPPSAPWCSNSRVGNGGFSLRSKKFLEIAAALKHDFQHEDVLVTNICYDDFISQGCRYAPVEVAMRFALESKIPECEYDLTNCFGFHGRGTAFYHSDEGLQFKKRIMLLDTIVF